MRRLLGLVLVLAAAWSGYWFVGARALERGAEDWFMSQAETGLVAERDNLGVRGFPNRFDLTVNGLRLFDPATGLGWDAPFVQVFALSYRPSNVIVAFPPEQVLHLPLQSLTLASNKLQGSATLAPGLPFGTRKMTVIGDGLALTSTQGWSVQAQTVRLATKAASEDGLDQEIGLEVLDLAPDPALSAALADLPGTVSRLRLDAIIGFGDPDPMAEQAPPPVSGVDLKEVLVTWGDLTLYGKGRLAANPAGQAEGRIDFRLTNWRKALPLAVAIGAVRPETLPTWENALTLLASQSGDGETLDLPLTMRGGRMSLGPLPLGPAPRLN